MTKQGGRWVRAVLLAIPCGVLYWAITPYQAGFFGVTSDASLVHLHFGFLLAVAMLYRDPLPLRLGLSIKLLMWLVLVHAGHPPPTTYLFGAVSALAEYGLLRLTARLMGWPRAGARFGAADVAAFVLYALVLLPLAIVATNVVFELVLVHPAPAWRVTANEQLQTFLAKFFGALALGLPMVVLGTHTGGRMAWWRLLAVGVAPPLALRMLAPHLGWDPALLPSLLLDNRLLIAAALVWVALHLPLRWSMPLLVLAQLLFAGGLAQDASGSSQPAEFIGLARTVLECTMLQLLVLLLMLYGKERDEAARQHERDSLVEPFTGLPNLAALRRRCAGTPPPLGFLLVDRTDRIAACLGLMAQAALMRWIAARLHGVVRAYHVGTGQLALVAAGTPDAPDWDAVLQRLHQADFVWRGQRMRVLPYLGVAGAEGDQESLDERLQRASRAAIEAKLRGEVRWLQASPAFTEGALHTTAQQSLALSRTVFSRIRAGEVELYFQPIAPLAAGAAPTVSGEVLCRLQDDAGQLLLPGQFLPELQEDRRMAELDLAVLRKLGAWIGEHRDRLMPLGYLSVNIAGQSLASREFARELLTLVDGFPLPAAQLCFEITETAAIIYAHESARLFAQLRERGCHIAIDDFGVGYQSFERLKQIPVDLIKIDGSFVRAMRISPSDLELVRASVRVARAFGAQTAAEYVEDAATAELLRRLQVDWMQGDHVGRAAPIETVLLAPALRAAAPSLRDA
ncbi:EAL domain-containing protein [Fulvimonas yonginensis]|uniref:EAL domain-containing protein n=1 Tax=Fulvimonas yonginensis TaxID=1495200 RepID=A0ABU8JGZ3_9GAMM